MDCRIRREKTELDSTAYVEIGPGKYSGRHWQPGFLFVSEEAFGVAEGIVARHFAQYDHFGMNEIPRAIGSQIVRDWSLTATRLPTMARDEALDSLNIAQTFSKRLDDQVIPNRKELAAMLNELAAEVGAYYEREEWVCILGL
jgi:hypothetical protein